MGLTADGEDGRPPGDGLTGRYLQPDISSHPGEDESERGDGGGLELASLERKSLSESMSDVSYEKEALTFPAVANPGSVGEGGVGGCCTEGVGLNCNVDCLELKSNGVAFQEHHYQ